MARQKEDTPESVSDARLRWLRSQTRKLVADVKRAIEGNSHTAVVSLRREQRHIRNEMDAEILRRAEAEKAAGQLRPQDVTPEEWRAHIRADAAATSDQDLELYVHEWLERSGLRLMVDQGEPRLMRAS